MSVKAALVLSSLIICSTPMVIGRLETPSAHLGISPAELPPELRLAWGSAGLNASPGEADWRAGRAGRLAAPSTFEREFRSQPSAARLVTLPAPQPAEYVAMTLPLFTPLEAEPVLPSATPDVVLVAAEETPAAPGAPASPGTPRTYQIAKGDTLARIAQRQYGSTDPRVIATLVAINPGLRGRETRLNIGEEIALPGPAALQQGATIAGLAGASSGSAAAPATADPRWYTIRPNDSLASIAQRYLKDKRRWPEIAAANTALDPRKMLPGTRIKLPLLQLAQQ